MNNIMLTPYTNAYIDSEHHIGAVKNYSIYKHYDRFYGFSAPATISVLQAHGYCIPVI